MPAYAKLAVGLRNSQIPRCHSSARMASLSQGLNVVDGNQQTAHMMQDDILTEPLPITSQPEWGVPQGSGCCVVVDEEKVARYHGLYREQGQFLPYDSDFIGQKIG